jgi:hypothetical protein
LPCRVSNDMESQLLFAQHKMYAVGRYNVVVLLWRKIEHN